MISFDSGPRLPVGGKAIVCGVFWRGSSVYFGCASHLIAYFGKRDHGFRMIVIADHALPERAITGPEGKPGFNLAMVLHIYSTAAFACSLLCGRRADADTSDEHAQIEGSPATEVGMWRDPPADQPGHWYQCRSRVEVRCPGKPDRTRLGSSRRVSDDELSARLKSATTNTMAVVSRRRRVRLGARPDRRYQRLQHWHSHLRDAAFAGTPIVSVIE